MSMRAGIIALITLGASAPAAATATFYTDKAAFLAAAAALTFESFESPTVAHDDLGVYAGTGVTVTCANVDHCIDYGYPLATDGVKTVGAYGDAGLRFAVNPLIHAFGIDLIGAGTGFQLTDISLVTPNAAGTLYTGYSSNNFDNVLFAGVIDTDGFHEVQFYGSDNSDFIAYDSLYFGDRAGGVPEPAAWAMLVTGFGLVGAARRRRAIVVA